MTPCTQDARRHSPQHSCLTCSAKLADSGQAHLLAVAAAVRLGAHIGGGRTPLPAGRSHAPRLLASGALHRSLHPAHSQHAWTHNTLQLQGHPQAAARNLVPSPRRHTLAVRSSCRQLGSLQAVHTAGRGMDKGILNLSHSSQQLALSLQAMHTAISGGGRSGVRHLGGAA